MPFSLLFLLDSATLFFASLATVVHGHVDPSWLVVVPIGLSTHPVAFFLSVHLWFLPVGIWNHSSFVFALRTCSSHHVVVPFGLSTHPSFAFFVLAVLSSSAWFSGSDGAKRGLYTALIGLQSWLPSCFFLSCQLPHSQS